MKLDDYVRAEHERIVDTLLAWLRIPSISAHPDRAGDVEASARFCAGLLDEAGLEHVTLLETPGAPAVYADWLHAAPTRHRTRVRPPRRGIPSTRSTRDEPAVRAVIVAGECRHAAPSTTRAGPYAIDAAARGLLRIDGRLPVNLKFSSKARRRWAPALRRPAARTRRAALVRRRRGVRHRHVGTRCAVDVRRDARVSSRSTCTSERRRRPALRVFGGAVPNPTISRPHRGRCTTTMAGHVARLLRPVRDLTTAEEASLRRFRRRVALMAATGVRRSTARPAGRRSPDRLHRLARRDRHRCRLHGRRMKRSSGRGWCKARSCGRPAPRDRRRTSLSAPGVRPSA